MEIKLDNSQITILVEIEGVIHLVGMSKSRLETIEFLVKNATDVVVPTSKTQEDLNKFLGYNK